MDRKWKDISTIESGTRWGKIKGRMMCVVGTICLGLKTLMFIRVTWVLRIWSQIWPLFQVLFGISSNSSYEYGSRASVLLMQEEINKKMENGWIFRIFIDFHFGMIFFPPFFNQHPHDTFADNCLGCKFSTIGLILYQPLVLTMY